MWLMYYHCPACQYHKIIDAKEMPKDLQIGASDGWGNYVYLEACPECGESQAGYLHILRDDDVCKNRAKALITKYYNLDGGPGTWVADTYKNRNRGE